MEAALKPCPFCAGTDIQLAKKFVWCGQCGAEGPSNDLIEAAIHDWNRREYKEPPTRRGSEEV